MSDIAEENSLGKYKLARSCAISFSKDPAYVLHFARNLKELEFAVAVSGTNEIKIYDEETFLLQKTLSGHKNTITEMMYAKEDSSILWTTSLDGTLRYWTTEGMGWDGFIYSKGDNGITCFDINCDGTILVTGSEKRDEEGQAESYVDLKVWDISNRQKPNCLSSFNSIHSDDITKIAFHPTKPKLVATGSLDGLVSILDISIEDENDVILQTLNTELSVESFGFFGPSNEFLYVLSSNENLQLWHYSEGNQLSNLGCLRNRLQKEHSIDYIIDCMFHVPLQRLFVIAGYYSGKFEIFHLNLDKMELHQQFRGGHSDMIRCFKFFDNCFFSGGEDGMLCLWLALPQSNLQQVKTNIGKMSIKSHREKPYKAKKKKQ